MSEEMTKKEFEEISNDIEENGELTDTPNDLTKEELESLEDEYEDPDDDEYEDVTHTETVTIVKQPIITSVVVGAEVDSKGVVKPMCKISLERHINPDDVEVSEFDIIENDFSTLAAEVKMQLISMKEEMNQ